MFWCSLFGHNYGITSAFGNYAFCSRCGSTLTIKDPYVLSPGERRWMHGKLMEMTEFGLEEVKNDDRKILTETTGYHETFKTTGHNQILTPNTRTQDETNAEESL